MYFHAIIIYCHAVSHALREVQGPGLGEGHPSLATTAGEQVDEVLKERREVLRLEKCLEHHALDDLAPVQERFTLEGTLFRLIHRCFLPEMYAPRKGAHDAKQAAQEKLPCRCLRVTPTTKPGPRGGIS